MTFKVKFRSTRMKVLVLLSTTEVLIELAVRGTRQTPQLVNAYGLSLTSETRIMPIRSPTIVGVKSWAIRTYLVSGSCCT